MVDGWEILHRLALLTLVFAVLRSGECMNMIMIFVWLHDATVFGWVVPFYGKNIHRSHFFLQVASATLNVYEMAQNHIYMEYIS